jgi:hypothetical protein
MSTSLIGVAIHTGSAAGEDHQPGDSILKQFPPGLRGEVGRDVDDGVGPGEEVPHDSRLRTVGEGQSRSTAEPHPAVGLGFCRESHHRRHHGTVHQGTVHQGADLGLLLDAVL